MISRRKLIRIAAPAIIGIAAVPKLARAMQLPFDGWAGSPFAFPAGRAPGFDPLHPMSKGISGIHGFSAVAQGTNFVNLVTGAPWAIFHPWTTALNNTLGPVAVSAANDSASTITGAAIADNNATVASIFSLTSAGTTQIWLRTTNTGASQGWQMQTNSSLLQLSPAISGGSAASFTNFTISSGVPYFAAISTNNATYYGVLVNLSNGVTLTQTVTISPNTVTASAGTYVLGVTLQTGSVLAAGMFAPFTASLSQLIQWSAAPWNFWYPPDMLMAELKGTAAAASPSHLLPLLGVGQ